jgi:C4-dicarboxylate-specific signal transduction histidine kinase
VRAVYRLNLVANGVDVMLAAGEKPQAWIACSGPDEEGRLHCRVEDNGPGVLEPQRTQVFESYYTTKPAGQGTGLGLRLVQQIIRSYGGDVTVAQRDGDGASFAFWLPAATAVSVAEQARPCD